jgi:TorA maturation chaperone TorD
MLLEALSSRSRAPPLPEEFMPTEHVTFSPVSDTEPADMQSNSGREPFIPKPAEEQARARFYGLLATLLLSPPSAKLLDALASADPMDGETGELASSWEQLVLVAGIMDAEAVREEFDALFVSTGTPLINPHASLYLSGFLMDRPLAALRNTLRELGVVRQVDVSELEDHLGSLFETMALLIQHGRPLRLQKAFFNEHIAGWAHACLDDMRNVQDARFYLHVAQVTDAFLELEREAFEIGDGTGV